tara:strand:- start:596 stop:1606 length:1011 start_codon:yes stop_codon:yes gene_type:complete
MMKNRGHTVNVIARDKEVTLRLLDFYKIPYVNRGKGANSLFGKFLDIITTDLKIFINALKFKPDYFISFGSMNMGHISFLLNKPHFCFDDTEHNKLNHIMYMPFTKHVITPYTFKKNMGKKHIKINAMMEFGSIHPNYFKPNKSIFEYLDLEMNEKYILLRFISWNAIHDRGQRGLSMSDKIDAINELSKFGKIFISSEDELPEKLNKYKINIPPEMMHDALYFSSLFYGESGTMAVEAALLGTPAVRISTLAKHLGNFTELNEKYSLLYHYDCPKKGIDMALNILSDPESKINWVNKAKKFFKEKIDLNLFMLWFFENYPKSKDIYNISIKKFKL